MLKRILVTTITILLVIVFAIATPIDGAELPRHEITKPIVDVPIKSQGVVVEKIDLTIDYDPITLKRGFGYYQGSRPMEEITAISFTNQHPKQYDEKWYANLSDTAEIMGYLIGSQVHIVGEKIYTNEYASRMFAGSNTYGDQLWASLAVINGLEYLDTSRTSDFDYMFYGNQNIVELDLNSWDMSNAVDLKFMFALCNNLETINIDKWDVSNVKYFAAMFQGHDWVGDMKLKNIDVSQWNTSSAISMNHMFYGCAQLEAIDVSNWNVENVTTFSHMFADCQKLQSIDLSNWRTNSVISFDAMFNDCNSLTTVNLSNVPTSTCIQFSQMFEDCENLTDIIGIEEIDVSNASNYAFSEMFRGCESLTTLDLSKWDVSQADNMARMFAKCPNLIYLNCTGWNISNVQTVTEMFCGTYNIEITGFDILSFENIKGYDKIR